MSALETTSLKAGPAARRIAAMRGIALQSIAGTGPRGWITKADALNANPANDAAVSGARYTATSAPYFHTSRDIEWPEANGVSLMTDAVIQTSGEIDTVMTRWTAGGINTPNDPTILYLIYGDASPAVARIRLKNRTQEDLGSKIAVTSTDCIVVHDFAKSDIASAAVLPMDGVTASLTIAAPKTIAASRDGGLNALRVRTATLSSDHRVIDGAVAAQWLQRFAERIEQAACES